MKELTEQDRRNIAAAEAQRARRLKTAAEKQKPNADRTNKSKVLNS